MFLTCFWHVLDMFLTCSCHFLGMLLTCSCHFLGMFLTCSRLVLGMFLAGYWQFLSTKMPTRWTVQIESSNKRSSKKAGGTPNSRISLQTRLEQFKDLVEFEGEVICRICKVVLEWTKRSRINDHMRSQKHIKAARKVEDIEAIPELSEAERWEFLKVDSWILSTTSFI